MQGCIVSWAKRRSKLIGSSVTVGRFNQLLNDHDLGLFGGDGEIVKELRERTNIGMVAIMAGCKLIGINLAREEIEEVIKSAGLPCELEEENQ